MALTNAPYYLDTQLLMFLAKISLKKLSTAAKIPSKIVPLEQIEELFMSAMLEAMKGDEIQQSEESDASPIACTTSAKAGVLQLEKELEEQRLHRVHSATYLMKQKTKEVKDSLPLTNNIEDIANMPEIPWEKAIINTLDSSLIIDDDAIDYYHSERVNSVEESELSFPLTAAGCYNGCSVTSSILGLSYPDRPSTLLAHFHAPKPVCSGCGTEGHRVETCSLDTFETVALQKWKDFLKTAPKVNEARMKQLSSALEILSAAHIELENQVKVVRNRFMMLLQDKFEGLYPGITFELFGSCANGFGSKTSDLDICVTFAEYSDESRQASTKEGIVKMLPIFRKQMFSIPGVSYACPVTTAKVPILKFGLDNSMQGDLSFYNLAIHNTRMIRKYAELEPKFKILGLALKTLTKAVSINDASSGTISSYGYILMLIHYLQQKN
ncbi:Terminal uridylyltransferase 4, partial [Cichlidogyrus casuarinus]